MGRCWSCGEPLEGGAKYVMNCPKCAGNKELEGLRQDLAAGVDRLAEIQQRGLDELSDELTGIATLLTWGFHDVLWRMEQQTDVLRSIDYKIGRDKETKANELRVMAEEQTARGIREQSEQPSLYSESHSELLDQAEQRFFQSLDLNPLDYSTYIGLARTYRWMKGYVKALDKARDVLRKSLPYAPRRALGTGEVKVGGERIEHRTNAGLPQPMTIPKEDFGKYFHYHGPQAVELQPKVFNLPDDMRSYSYRLIGRTYFCEEQYAKAAEALELAVKLSPEWPDANYDYSQYCARVGKKDESLGWLAKAILANSIYFYLTQKEENFDPLRQDVDALLRDITKRASEQGRARIAEAEIQVQSARQAVESVEKSMAKAGGNGPPSSRGKCDLAETTLRNSRSRLDSGDYRAILESKDLAILATMQAREAQTSAPGEKEQFEKVFAEELKSARNKIPGNVRKGAFWGSVALAIVVLILAAIGANIMLVVVAIPAFLVLGVLIGGLVGYSAYREIANRRH